MSAKGTKRASGRPSAGDTSIRDALLRAAATHFSTYGFAGASTRAILADAQATAPTMYHHFGSKTGLYIAAASAAQEHVLSAFGAAAADRGAGVEQASALLHAAVALRREHPNVARYLNVIQQDVARHPELDELRSYNDRFDQFWQAVADERDGIARSMALRAVIEGLVAVGGPSVTPEQVDDAGAVLDAIFRSGLSE